MIQQLLQLGCDINQTTAQLQSALSYACEYSSNLSIIRCLLQADADILQLDHYGNSIVMKAILNGNMHLLRLLMEFNGIYLIDLKNQEGQSPLLLAIIRNQIDMVHYLLDLEVDVNIQDVVRSLVSVNCP